MLDNIISVIAFLKHKYGQVHLDKVLIELPDHLQLLALGDSGLLQDLLLLYEKILKEEKRRTLFMETVVWQLSRR